MPPKTNSEGQFYPWAIEGKDFATYESVFKLSNFLPSFADMIGKMDETGMYASELKQMVADENESFLSDVQNHKLVGGETRGDEDGLIKVSEAHQGYSEYIAPEQKERVDQMYRSLKGIAGEAGAHLRNLYESKGDAKSRHLQERADQLADFIDLQVQATDPKAGNIAEAEFHAPYLYVLNIESSSTPKFETEGLEKCVSVLEQSDVKGGKSIYDDYMSVMSAGARETKVQFHRQKMEAEGWDAEKEATYLRELRSAHQQTVEAYDRLWEVDDKGQYDSVLNNKLDHMIGKSPSNRRDSNAAMGFMRGEMRAIDLGYDSKHLHALGQIGMQEQALKKKFKEMEVFMSEAKNPERKQELQEQLDRMNTYKEDLDRLKESLWNKRVTTREEMEATGKQVDDFFADHQKDYGDIQRVQSIHGLQLKYGREEAARSPEMPKPQTELTIDDFKTIGSTSTVLSVQKIDEAAAVNYANQFSKTKDGENGKLTPQSEQAAKKLAGDFLTKFNEKISELEKNPTNYPHATDFQKSFLNRQRRKLENFCSGIPVNSGSPYMDRGSDYFWNIEANMDTECFKPENLEKTEKAVADYALDKYADTFEKLQKRQLDFEMGKDQMMPAERRQAYRELMDGKRAMIARAKELQKKMDNPSPELLDLFAGKEEQLKDFQGVRGLQGVINRYSEELARTDVPQAKGIDQAMAKFNTSRASVFKDESPEHRQMREAAEKLQQDIKKLQNGMIKDQETGEERPFTEQEREGMLKETWGSMKALEEKTNQYIAHATKNGTKTPHTPAGKARLAGAMAMKNLTGQLKEHLGKESSLEKEYARDKRMADRTKKLGKSAAEKLGEMDKEVEKFQSMSQLEFHNNSSDSIAYGLDECQFQAARVIAISAVEEAAMKGQIEGKDIRKQVINNTRDIAKDPAFQKWIKNASETSRMKDLGKMSPNKLREDFVKSMSRDMSKENKKEKIKKKAPAKTEKTVEKDVNTL